MESKQKAHAEIRDDLTTGRPLNLWHHRQQQWHILREKYCEKVLEDSEDEREKGLHFHDE